MKKVTIIVLSAVLAIVLAGGTGYLTYNYTYDLAYEKGYQEAPDGYTGDTEVTDAQILEIMEKLQTSHINQPEDEELLQGMIEGMIDALDDPFTTYFDYDEYAQYQTTYGESYVGIGVTISYINETLVVEEVKNGGPADEAGILPNDIFVTVDGTDISGMNFYDIRDMIIGEVGTTVSIGLIRQGYNNVIVLEMERAVIDKPTVEYQVIDHGTEKIGYISVTTFGDVTAQLFNEAIAALEAENITGLVIDLRNNGGGHLGSVLSMLQEFLLQNNQPIFSTEFYDDDGELHVNRYGGTRTEKRDYDIVTLVNGNSASASEVFSSAMQEHGDYLVVGTQTYGKGTMQTDKYVTSTCTVNSFQLLDCSEADIVHITIGKWFTADGNWVHYNGGTDGVTPDVIVEKSANELLYKLFLLDDETLVFDTVDARVSVMQKILVIMGYDVRTDGYFDTETLDAIKDIQTDNGLTPDGIVTNETMSYLNEALDAYKDDLDNDTQLQAALDTFND